MPAAVRLSLQSAALNTYDDIIANYVLGAVDQTKRNLQRFLDNCPYLNDESPQERTVRNWVPMLRDNENRCPSTLVNPAAVPVVTIDTDYVSQMAELLANFMWAAHYALAAGRITAPQGAAILASYNAWIGVFVP